jgi:hypothetical protein
MRTEKTSEGAATVTATRSGEAFMYEHDGLEWHELGNENFTNEQGGDGIASAMHGAVALLHTVHSDRAGRAAAMASWTAVYGTNFVEPDLDDLQDQFRARRPATIPDAFLAGAVAMGDAVSGPTSALVSQQLAAHVRIETELVRRLAEVTGRPVGAVLAYLEEWAAAEEPDEH